MDTTLLKQYDTVKLFGFSVFCDELKQIDFNNRIVINTINPHSYHVALNDKFFHDSLMEADILLPDGVGIVLANKLINKTSIQKIAGYDIFLHILESNRKKPIKCFFLGSKESTLSMIKARLRKEYPNVEFDCYSPPFKSEFSEEDNAVMIDKINEFSPDFLFVGMTAPKQEKWTKANFKFLDVKVVCNIGAVFDFYAGTTKRAPEFMVKSGLEWLHRSFKSTRLLKRTLTTSPLFVHYTLVEFVRNLIKPEEKEIGEESSKSYQY
ncbi:WecB/TagA/CpsF family glycosyltransferase [Belliella kenyensis]|uniref:WecB/TagA/CpsF family glycosyltransferase n=1 Tax=Belliella kenyensis TaxID=1472724 RepID=A0ABV8EJ68_9BACT|nr:WecB/TagA/CpsF family glycosyltransferase [Belliella kenyensis]MCH7403847.1 WecB/TagA/CpsF family glycosyltransferase [Belliella kenyensis]MDN3603815.1 WecB/TagA/CpsF family glycosyltransferase [Belliella kenyensis]